MVVETPEKSESAVEKTRKKFQEVIPHFLQTPNLIKPQESFSVLQG